MDVSSGHQAKFLGHGKIYRNSKGLRLACLEPIKSRKWEPSNGADQVDDDIVQNGGIFPCDAGLSEYAHKLFKISYETTYKRKQTAMDDLITVIGRKLAEDNRMTTRKWLKNNKMAYDEQEMLSLPLKHFRTLPSVRIELTRVSQQQIWNGSWKQKWIFWLTRICGRHEQRIFLHYVKIHKDAESRCALHAHASW